MALPQISRRIRAVGGHGASKEGSWEHRHVLSVTQQERSRLLCPLRLRLFPYHRPTPPCSRHPAPTLPQTGCFLPRIHLPAVPGPGLASGTRCSAVLGSFRGGSRGRGAGTAAPLCASLPDPRCCTVLTPSRPSPLGQVLAEPFAR